MSNKFQVYKQLDLSRINKEVLKKWGEDDTFHKSISTREGHPTFVFYEGPPSANGMPGIHHVMARAIKDTFCRYKTMKGFRVHRKSGWYTSAGAAILTLPTPNMQYVGFIYSVNYNH